jgi:hypothetical protein
MTEQEPISSSTPAEAPRKSMPRPAVRAIAYSGYFCALTTFFLAYYAHRMGFHPAFVALNVVTALFLMVGSWWMLDQLKKRP